MATSYLLDTSDLKRSLGFIDEDDSFDSAAEARLQSCLKAAEDYVQGAVGEDVSGFYQANLNLYKLACNSLAASYYQNPTSLTTSPVNQVDLVANSVIGQLRGRYANEAIKDGTDSESQSIDSKNPAGNNERTNV